MRSRNSTTCKARPHGVISSARKTGRMGTTLQVVVNESRAAKHSFFSTTGSRCSLYFTSGRSLQIACKLADFVRAVGIRWENHHNYQLGW